VAPIRPLADCGSGPAGMAAWLGIVFRCPDAVAGAFGVDRTWGPPRILNGLWGLPEWSRYSLQGASWWSPLCSLPPLGICIDAARLALLPDGAIVVNGARGALLDEHRRLSELDSGRLRGAGPDVFATEPLASRHAGKPLHYIVDADAGY